MFWLQYFVFADFFLTSGSYSSFTKSVYKPLAVNLTAQMLCIKASLATLQPFEQSTSYLQLDIWDYTLRKYVTVRDYSMRGMVNTTWMDVNFDFFAEQIGTNYFQISAFTYRSVLAMDNLMLTSGPCTGKNKTIFFICSSLNIAHNYVSIYQEIRYFNCNIIGKLQFIWLFHFRTPRRPNHVLSTWCRRRR